MSRYGPRLLSLQGEEPIHDVLLLPALRRQKGLLGSPVVLLQLQDAAEPSNTLMHGSNPPSAIGEGPSMPIGVRNVLSRDYIRNMKK